MGYVAAGIVVLLVAAGFVTFMVVNATRRGRSAAPEDPGAEGNPIGIVSSDESPAGDTTQHAGDQRGGETVADADGEGTAGGDGGSEDRRPVPASERLANRPR
jgi:hypothetical protein